MKHLSALIITLSIFFAIHTPVLAQIPLNDQLNSQSGFFNAPFKIERIETVVMGAVNWLLIAAGISMFGCILYSGLQYQMGGANKTNIESAKSRLSNCLIGLAVVSLAHAIILIVQVFFGITLFPS